MPVEGARGGTSWVGGWGGWGGWGGVGGVGWVGGVGGGCGCGGGWVGVWGWVVKMNPPEKSRRSWSMNPFTRSGGGFDRGLVCREANWKPLFFFLLLVFVGGCRYDDTCPFSPKFVYAVCPEELGFAPYVVLARNEWRSIYFSRLKGEAVPKGWRKTVSFLGYQLHRCP